MTEYVSGLVLGLVFGGMIGAGIYASTVATGDKEIACEALHSKLDNSGDFCLNGNTITLRF